jgi:hypothetical protein
MSEYLDSRHDKQITSEGNSILSVIAGKWQNKASFLIKRECVMNIRAMLNKAFNLLPSHKYIEEQIKNPTVKGQIYLSAFGATVGGVGHAAIAGLGIAVQAAMGFTYDNIKEIMLTEMLGGGFTYALAPMAAYNKDNIFVQMIGPVIYIAHPLIGRALYSLVSEPASSITDAPCAISPFYLVPLAVGVVMFGNQLCQKHFLAADTNFESPGSSVRRHRD